mgnify:CR=1 FL=1
MFYEVRGESGNWAFTIIVKINSENIDGSNNESIVIVYLCAVLVFRLCER